MCVGGGGGGGVCVCGGGGGRGNYRQVEMPSVADSSVPSGDSRWVKVEMETSVWPVWCCDTFSRDSVSLLVVLSLRSVTIQSVS